MIHLAAFKTIRRGLNDVNG